MRLFKTTTIIILCFITAVMCTSRTQKHANTGVEYMIPDSVYSFFPGDCKNCELGIVSTNAEKMKLPYFKEEFVIFFITKVYSCKNIVFFESFKNKLSKKSLKKFKSEDSTYFVIGSERDILQDYDSVRLKKNYQNHQGIPLTMNFREIFKETPNFYSTATICGLPKDYEILILKSGNTPVLPEKYKYDWDLLPKQLKHGYASGVAFKEPYIIYWVVAW